MAGRKKLSDTDVAGIRYAIGTEGLSFRQVAQVYGVSHIQIWRVFNKLQRKNKKATP